MLAPGRYPQWRSRFLQYGDTRPNGEDLRKCILSGPYKPTTVLVHAVEATDDSLEVPEHTTIHKPTNNNLRTSSNSKNKNVDTTPRKPKRVKDSAYHKEKMLLCKQAEQGVPLQAEQYDWLVDMDEEVDEQELEAHYSYMAKIQVVPTADSGTDSKPVEQVQNEAGYNVFANHLQHYEQSEFVSNTCLVETDDSNVTPDSPDMCKDDIQNEQNDVHSDDEQVDEQELEVHYSYMAKIQVIPTADSGTDSKPVEQSDSLKFVHELKQEMHADLKYVETLEKEIDKLKSKKAEFSDMYDVILQDCVSKDVMCSYLQSLFDLDALAELQCMYLHKVKECDCLAQKLSKQTEYVSRKVHTELLQRFAKVEKHSISLELALQKCKEQTLPQAAKKAVRNTNVLKPGMYRIDNRTAHTRAPQLP
nr:hypothetical protein [Tanacetum cinerariifolium]